MPIIRRALLSCALALAALVAFAQPANPDFDRLVSAMRCAEDYQAQVRSNLGTAKAPATERDRAFRAVMIRVATVDAAVLKPAFAETLAGYLSPQEARELAGMFESGDPVRPEQRSESQTAAYEIYSSVVASGDYIERIYRRIVASPAFADLGTPAELESLMEQLAPSETELRKSVDSSLVNHVSGFASTVPAKLVRGAVPQMPRDAIQADIAGEVEVEFLIDKSGRVAEIHIIRSPHELLSNAVIDALRQWEFTPMMEGGTAVPFVAHQVFDFKVSD